MDLWSCIDNENKQPAAISFPLCCSTTSVRTWRPPCFSHWKRHCRRPQTPTVGESAPCLLWGWNRASGLSNRMPPGDDQDGSLIFFHDYYLVSDSDLNTPVSVQKKWVGWLGSHHVFTRITWRLWKWGALICGSGSSECFITNPSSERTIRSHCGGTRTNNTLPCRDFELTRP